MRSKNVSVGRPRTSASLKRRRFLERVGGGFGAAMTVGLFAPDFLARLEASAARTTGASPQEVAADEAFWRDIQQSFSVSRSVIYLNSAGGSPSPRAVTEAAVHGTWEQEKVPSDALYNDFIPRLESIRTDLAGLFGCDPEEVAVVRNATEAIQTVLLGLELKPGDEVLTTTLDYWALMNALEQRRLRGGIVVKKIQVPVPPETMEDLSKAFEQAISPRTKLILVSHPVNLTGQHFPIKRICEMAHARGIEVVVDGAQSFGQLDIKQTDLGCDYFGASLQKWLMAPKSTGMLYVRRDKIAKLWPLQPADAEKREDIRKFEMVGAQSSARLGIGEAIAFHNGIGGKRKEARLRYLTNYWMDRLRRLPNARFQTSSQPEMRSAIATIDLPGIDSGALFDYLRKRHQIVVFNVARRTSEFQGIRATPGLHTTLSELDRFCDAMEHVAKQGLPR